MSEVGDYVIVKGQKRALYIKEGGVVIIINEPMAIVTDGKNTCRYNLRSLRPFKTTDNTLYGCHLVVAPSPNTEQVEKK